MSERTERRLNVLYLLACLIVTPAVSVYAAGKVNEVEIANLKAQVFGLTAKIDELSRAMGRVEGALGTKQ